MADRILTRQEMILLHLLQYIDVPVSGYVMPHAMTQQGRSRASDSPPGCPGRTSPTA